MPIFEFKCKCGKLFEFLIIPGKETNEIKCPQCEGTQVSKLISKPFLPNSVGAPADLSSSVSCCGSGSSPENKSCTPGECCGGANE